MLSREEKANVVAELGDRFTRQRVSLFADIRGISVAKLSQFRRELKKLGAELKVSKKTLLKRALDACGLAIEPKELEGEVGIIFGYEDQVAPARAAAKFAKEHETFKIRKGILEGKILEPTDVLALARLPSREQLLEQIALALNAPIQGLAHVLQGNIRNLVVVLSRIKAQK